jgi:ribosome biogenesis GTPase
LSKTDLLSSEEINTKITQIKEIAPDLIVHGFSSKNGTGLGKIKEYLKPAHTYCLLGSSGVGKTTLLNHLIGKELFETASVRQKDSKGRHTTTNRLLIQLENGAMIIDSPGMRELGVFAVGQGIDETFSDITHLAQNCRFNDCSHINQKGCAVLEALNKGGLDPDRYQNFIKMKKQTSFYEMYYLEKKKKDKQFGKMDKSAMKIKKRL